MVVISFCFEPPLGEQYQYTLQIIVGHKKHPTAVNLVYSKFPLISLDTAEVNMNTGGE